jgi:aminopeptidase N
MEDLTLSWNIFIDEQYWGLSEDQKNTTHPISANCESTGDAQDIFDGISYGKGAAFLHQMVFYLGKDLLKEGLKTYFAKHKFRNT